MGPGSEAKSFCTQERLSGSHQGTVQIKAASGRHCQEPSLTFVGKGKGGAVEKTVTRRRREGVGWQPRMILISMMHPHGVMEPFTVRHMTVSFIYVSCF